MNSNLRQIDNGEIANGEIDEITGQTTRVSVLKKITKTPIEPTEEEIARNQRSRSAKLRVYEKN